jgi:hypothetical protein
MAKVINLSRVRKRKSKEEERRLADLNAVRHGLSKPERKKAQRTREIETKNLDGKRLQGSEVVTWSGEVAPVRPVVVPFPDRRAAVARDESNSAIESAADGDVVNQADRGRPEPSES